MRFRGAVLAFLFVASSAAADCPDREGGPADSPPKAERHVVTYRTGLGIDIDGSPNAYGVDGDRSPAPGGALDHICNGGSVLAAQPDKTLKNKYPNFRIPGSSQNCLADYRKLRDANFPGCDSGLCMKFFGLQSSERACRYRNGPAKGSDCGLPLRQKNADGTVSAYYVSVTPYHRNGAREDDQTGYPDARYVPYLVYDPSVLRPLGVKIGDLALVAWKGRATFAVYGDGGNPSLRSLARDQSPAVRTT